MRRDYARVKEREAYRIACYAEMAVALAARNGLEKSDAAEILVRLAAETLREDDLSGDELATRLAAIALRVDDTALPRLAPARPAGGLAGAVRAG